MARKNKANRKTNQKLSRMHKDTDSESQESITSSREQMLFPHNNGSKTPDCLNNPPIALSVTGRVDKGKGKADPRVKPSPVQPSEIQDGTSNNLSTYQQNYQDAFSDQQRYIRHASTSSLVPYPSPNMSRDTSPSGSFFEGPTEKVEINGSTVNHTLGHHTTVNINVNRLHGEEYDTLQQIPQQPVYIFPSSVEDLIHPILIQAPQMSPDHNATPPIQDIHRGQFPPVPMYDQGVSSSTMVYPPESSNKIYERHLLLQQRGFPLWIPEPSRTLPMPYRRKGVNIGDVGIITSSGAFSFLFNICLPPDDPINPVNLPDGFAPIYPPIEPMDICEHPEFYPESYLAGTTIEKNDNPQLRGLSFVTSAAEGGVLTFPDGAISRDLLNVPRIRAYAAANLENWYRYTNLIHGREAKNGELRLVVGCDKATSWGMAAVANNVTQNKTHYLNYRPIDNDGEIPAPIPLYKWEHTGVAAAKVGPGLQDIATLARNDDSDAAVDGKYWNQCLFVRTLNLTLNDDVFTAINQELESALSQEPQQHYNRGRPSNLSSNSQNLGNQTDDNTQPQGSSSTTQTRSTSEDLGSTSENMAIGNVVRERVTMETGTVKLLKLLPNTLRQSLPSICRTILLMRTPRASEFEDDLDVDSRPRPLTDRKVLRILSRYLEYLE